MRDVTLPWDDEHRVEYMVEEVGLPKLYDGWDLGQRTNVEIETSAMEVKDVKSMLEL